MYIYNTLSRKKEELKKTRKTLKLFVCGPTVYDSPHIGHARVYITFDVIARYLRSKGYKLYYLQNITDIDDKIIKRASELGVQPQKLAQKYTREYLSAMQKLGVIEVDKYAPATKYISAIVKQVKTLIKKGYAYKAKDGYYFDIAKFKDYGKLSGRTAEQAEDSVSRIDESVNKHNKGDFALWKFSKEGEPSWKTELGEGRPGWHIEDTAITNKVFGPQYDLHGGGLDLKFPHHEAEIAQAEAASDKKPFVKVWMHSGLLNINSKKMSKSLGNFISITEFLSKYPPEVLRWLFLGAHYRQPIDFTDALIAQSSAGLETLREFVRKARFVAEKNKASASSAEFRVLLEKAESDFISAMEDDFNTPGAVSALFSFVAGLQNVIWQISKKDAKRAAKFIENKLELYGIEGLGFRKISSKAAKMALQRDKLRDNKQFIQADALRKQIEGLGYMVEDTPLGTWLNKKT